MNATETKRFVSKGGKLTRQETLTMLSELEVAEREAGELRERVAKAEAEWRRQIVLTEQRDKRVQTLTEALRDLLDGVSDFQTCYMTTENPDLTIPDALAAMLEGRDRARAAVSSRGEDA